MMNIRLHYVLLYLLVKHSSNSAFTSLLLIGFLMNSPSLQRHSTAGLLCRQCLWMRQLLACDPSFFEFGVQLKLVVATNVLWISSLGQRRLPTPTTDLVVVVQVFTQGRRSLSEFWQPFRQVTIKDEYDLSVLYQKERLDFCTSELHMSQAAFVPHKLEAIWGFLRRFRSAVQRPRQLPTLETVGANESFRQYMQTQVIIPPGLE